MNTVLSQPNLGGRPPGAINHATRSMKAIAQQFFESEEYRASMKQRILAGTAPALEVYLLQMLYGKPKEHVQLDVAVQQEDLSTLSVEELAQRAESLLSQLKDAKELEEAVNAEFVSVNVDVTEVVVDAQTVAEMREAAILAEVAKRAALREKDDA
jgi:hypothetical protein